MQTKTEYSIVWFKYACCTFTGKKRQYCMILRKLFYPHSLIVTGLVFALVWLLDIIRINAHFLNPFKASPRDYEITDLVYSRLWDARLFTAPPA